MKLINKLKKKYFRYIDSVIERRKKETFVTDFNYLSKLGFAIFIGTIGYFTFLLANISTTNPLGKLESFSLYAPIGLILYFLYVIILAYSTFSFNSQEKFFGLERDIFNAFLVMIHSLFFLFGLGYLQLYDVFSYSSLLTESLLEIFNLLIQTLFPILFKLYMIYKSILIMSIAFRKVNKKC